MLDGKNEQKETMIQVATELGIKVNYAQKGLGKGRTQCRLTVSFNDKLTYDEIVALKNEFYKRCNIAPEAEPVATKTAKPTKTVKAEKTFRVSVDQKAFKQYCTVNEIENQYAEYPVLEIKATSASKADDAYTKQIANFKGGLFVQCKTVK